QSEADVLHPQLIAERKNILRMGQTASLHLVNGRHGFGDVERIYGHPLKLLMIAVGLMLVIACTNLANLQLARAGTREREIAVRHALGCGRSRLIRQLFVESLLLAGLGGAIGLILAPVAAQSLLWVSAPPGLAWPDVSVDKTILMFTVSVSFLASLLFGLIP